MPDSVVGSSRVHVVEGKSWRKHTVQVTGRRRSHHADILLGRAATVGAVARQGSRAGHWVARGRCREYRCPERRMITKEPDEGDGAGPGSVGSVGRHGGEGDSPRTRERSAWHRATGRRWCVSAAGAHRPGCEREQTHPEERAKGGTASPSHGSIEPVSSLKKVEYYFLLIFCGIQIRKM